MFSFESRQTTSNRWNSKRNSQKSERMVRCRWPTKAWKIIFRILFFHSNHCNLFSETDLARCVSNRKLKDQPEIRVMKRVHEGVIEKRGNAFWSEDDITSSVRTGFHMRNKLTINRLTPNEGSDSKDLGKYWHIYYTEIWWVSKEEKVWGFKNASESPSSRWGRAFLKNSFRYIQFRIFEA